MKKFLLTLLSTTLLFVMLSFGLSSKEVEATLDVEPVVYEEPVEEEPIDERLVWEELKDNAEDVKFDIDEEVTTDEIIEEFTKIKEVHFNDHPIDPSFIKDYIPAGINIANVSFKVGNPNHEDYPYNLEYIGEKVTSKLSVDGHEVNEESIRWGGFQGLDIEVKLDDETLLVVIIQSLEQLEFIANYKE